MIENILPVANYSSRSAMERAPLAVAERANGGLVPFRSGCAACFHCSFATLLSVVVDGELHAVEREEGEDDVRGDAHAVGSESAVEGQRALRGQHLARAVDRVLVGENAVRVGLLLLNASLDAVEGKRAGGRGNSGQTLGADVPAQTNRHTRTHTQQGESQ